VSVGLKSKGGFYIPKFLGRLKTRIPLHAGREEERTPYLYIWLGFFAYSVLVAAAIQFIILPYIFPGWHEGGGLLKGLDCVWFHNLAVELSQQILARGWSAWELRPSGQAPSGIAGAIYALTVPKLWTTIPLNAVLHATAAYILFRILQMFTSGWKMAVLLVCPFLLYPSSVTWLSQNHKDGYTIAGAFLFVYGWILLLRTDTWNSWTRPLKSILFIFPGAVLCWIVRPYTIELLKGAGILIALLATVTYLVRMARRQLPVSQLISAVLLVWALIYVLHLPLFPGSRSFFAHEGAPAKMDQSAAEKLNMAVEKLDMKSNERTESLIMEISSKYLPDPVMTMLRLTEKRLAGLALYRRDYMFGYPNAKSYIDPNIKLHNMDDYISFVPRAMQIAFLSPFPSMWFGQGSVEQNTLMRRISAFEMIFLYFCLLGIPISVYYFYRRPEFWVVIIFCTSILLVYGFGMPNAGTLYRMRYGFIMMIAAMGLTGHCLFFRKLQRRRGVHSSAGLEITPVISDASSDS